MKHNISGLVLRSLRAKKAFTLVELMVTVTIIAIVSVVMISPFKMLIDGMDTRDRSNHIADMIRSLDESIENNKAASYEAVFTTGSMGFVTNQDWYKKSPVITGTFDFETGSGMLQSTGTWTGGLSVRLTGDDYDDRQDLFPDGGIYNFSFPIRAGGGSYIVQSALDDTFDSPLNSFLIRYYYLPEDTDVAENPTRLVSITSRTGSGYTALKIRNVHGARTILGYTGTITDTVKPDNLKGVKLVFEKDGTEMVTLVGEMR
ncbi:MAG: prepilin-type N-terminal cleavage/methylation domain-containing protein [Candidatus Gracilibacteria bacterium]|nr:prepilin-type N-terminal cleavage/methylation domain-containing protein [Candidatus Gracilibacteria bacterium]